MVESTAWIAYLSAASTSSYRWWVAGGGSKGLLTATSNADRANGTEVVATGHYRFANRGSALTQRTNKIGGPAQATLWAYRAPGPDEATTIGNPIVEFAVVRDGEDEAVAKTVTTLSMSSNSAVATLNYTAEEGVSYRYRVAWTGGSTGSGTAATSSSGEVWTSGSSGTLLMLEAVARNDSSGLWVAVGKSGTILTSTDGDSWTRRTGATADFLAVASSPSGTWVATGYNGAVWTSTNGSTWTARTSGTTAPLTSVAYGGGQWVAVGYNGTILTSPDGTTWTSRSSGTTLYLWGLAHSDSDGLWVAVGDYGGILTSTDGVTWTVRTSGTSQYLWDVARSDADDLWVAVGYGSTILTSPDGASWTVGTAPGSFRSVARSESEDVWTILDIFGAIYTSPDATTWTRRTSRLSDGRAVAYSEEQQKFVAVGDRGQLATSAAGTYTTAPTAPFGVSNGGHPPIVSKIVEVK